MATTSEDSLLNQATKTIIHLKNEIQKLTDTLREREALLSGLMDVSARQSKRLASFTASMQDTVHWDPRQLFPVLFQHRTYVGIQGNKRRLVRDHQLAWKP
ncbi:unnamed protein product [Gadus morhua 'NCC']